MMAAVVLAAVVSVATATVALETPDRGGSALVDHSNFNSRAKTHPCSHSSPAASAACSTPTASGSASVKLSFVALVTFS